MHIEATLGVKSRSDDDVKPTMKHSISCSSILSARISIDIHSEVLVSDIVNDPVWAT